MLRAKALAATKEYAEAFLEAKEFVPEVSTVPVSGKILDSNDFVSLVDSSLDGWFTAGRFTEDFQRQLARYVGARKSLFVNSGSSANLVALSALTSPKLGKRALKPGDEVLTTDLEYGACDATSRKRRLSRAST